jgi:1-acyl-sn-glycerol-3-phosphate acyltransferase
MRSFVKQLLKLYYKVFFRVEVKGIDNLKLGDAKVICANHISNHDPVVIGTFLPEHIRFMAKHTLFKHWYADKFLRFAGGFPVNRDVNDLGAIKTALKALKNKESVLIFAEGTRNMSRKPLEAKAGVAMIAVKSKVPIQPVTVDSTYKVFSKIIITVHPVVDLSEHYKERHSNEAYQEIAQTVVNDIYKSVSLFYTKEGLE